MTDDLQPMTPREAHDMYLKARDIADTTRRAHSRRIRRLVRWCEGEGEIDNTNDLTGRDVHVFKIEEFAEKEDGTDYSKETIRSTMNTTRVFLRWCESPSPENTRDETVDRTLAANILGHLATYEYASFRHCYVQLLWHAGLRLGGLTHST
jgi:site-specific recombinase XerD